MWENSQAIRESAEFQINFKPLSPVKAKPQLLSCCDLILFCALSPLFFYTEDSFLYLKKEAETHSQEQPAALANRGSYSQNLHLLTTVICWSRFGGINNI